MELTRLKELLETVQAVRESENTDEIDVIRKLVDENIKKLEIAAKGDSKDEIDEILDDLQAELGDRGSLESFMKKSGALAHDLELDDDNQTILTRIQGRMEQFKAEVQDGSFKHLKLFRKEIEKLLDEVDIIVSSGEKQVTEAKLPPELAKLLDRKANGADEVSHEGKTYARRGPKNSTSTPGSWKLVESLTEAKAEYDDSSDFTEEFYGMFDALNKLRAIVKAPKFIAWMKTTDSHFGTECESHARDVIRGFDSLNAQLNLLSDELDQAS